MPFTFSHAAIVLPLKYVNKRYLSLTALVIGSITPDFEYFFRMKIQSRYSHTWAGLLWFDLPLAFYLLLIYNIVIKDKLIDNLPPFLNKRFSSFKGFEWLDFKILVVTLISLLIGAASHLIWDSFTHPAGYFVQHISYFKHRVHIAGHSLSIYNILQHLSSLFGALILVLVIYRLPSGRLTSSKSIVYFWLRLIFVAITVAWLRTIINNGHLRAGSFVVTSISGILIGLIITSAIQKRNYAGLA